MTSRFVCGLVLLAIVGLNQPASAATSKSAASQSKSSVPPKAAADSQIEQTMRLKLAKSKLRADGFTFSVSKGVVTIEGNTNVMQHKGVMTRMAKLSGATAVRNNIRISDAAKAKAAATLVKGRTAAMPQGGGDAATGTPAAVPRAVVLPTRSR